MKIGSLKAGDVLWEASTYRMGSLRSVGVYEIRVLDVDPDGEWFTASWNGNPARRRYAVPPRWRRTKPVTVEMVTGRRRLATREEKKKMEENK